MYVYMVHIYAPAIGDACGAHVCMWYMYVFIVSMHTYVFGGACGACCVCGACVCNMAYLCICNEICITVHLNVTQWFLAIFMEHRLNTAFSVA